MLELIKTFIFVIIKSYLYVTVDWIYIPNSEHEIFIFVIIFICSNYQRLVVYIVDRYIFEVMTKVLLEIRDLAVIMIYVY